MGTVSENQKVWTEYDWQQQGDEWSVEWGTNDLLWWGTIMPRIHTFVPTQTILEIAPGFGRCTQYLQKLCQRLTVVDLAERCIEACQQRFSSSRHITYHVNDGKSLDMVADESIDFAFSYDSLVHVESDVIEAYLSQLAKKLKPNGVGFLHHSNLGAYVNRETGKLAFYVDNKHDGSNWRGQSVSAELFAERCESVGLQCIAQELIAFYPEFSLKWSRPGARLHRISHKLIDRYGIILNDCFSLFTRRNSVWARPNKISVNKNFMNEAKYLSRMSPLYAGSSFTTNSNS